MTAKCVDATSRPALRIVCPHLPPLLRHYMYAKSYTVFQISLFFSVLHQYFVS